MNRRRRIVMGFRSSQDDEAISPAPSRGGVAPRLFGPCYPGRIWALPGARLPAGRSILPQQESRKGLEGRDQACGGEGRFGGDRRPRRNQSTCRHKRSGRDQVAGGKQLLQIVGHAPSPQCALSAPHCRADAGDGTTIGITERATAGGAGWNSESGIGPFRGNFRRACVAWCSQARR
jgi:hypothetical protein